MVFRCFSRHHRDSAWSLLHTSLLRFSGRLCFLPPSRDFGASLLVDNDLRMHDSRFPTLLAVKRGCKDHYQDPDVR